MNSGKILLVDDEPRIIREFERSLKREGYTVDTAESGEVRLVLIRNCVCERISV